MIHPYQFFVKAQYAIFNLVHMSKKLDFSYYIRGCPMFRNFTANRISRV